MSRLSSEPGGLGEEDSYRFKAPDLSTTFPNALNSNILGLIEEVKRQRGDVLKLSGELKSSRAQIDRRALEEAKAKQDMASAVRQLRKERDEAASEAKTLRDMLGLSERKLGERDEMVRELRNKASDYLRSINELQMELESAKFALSKLHLNLDEAAKARRGEDDSAAARALEERAAELFAKYKEESQKALRLQRELRDAASANQRLAAENALLAQPDRAGGGEQALTQELRASLAAFERLQLQNEELLGLSHLALQAER